MADDTAEFIAKCKNAADSVKLALFDGLVERVQADARRLELWPELVRQLDRANDLLSVCDLDAPSDVADIEEIRKTLAKARKL